MVSMSPVEIRNLSCTSDAPQTNLYLEKNSYLLVFQMHSLDLNR